MKKFFISILVTICLISSCFSINAQETEDMTCWNYSLISETVDPFDTRVTKYKNKNTGKFGFCIEPNEDFYRSRENYTKESYSNEDNLYISKLINAFEHLILTNDGKYSENDYYIATQLKIWEIITGNSPTIKGNDAYSYGLEDLEEYIANNYKEIDIHIDDIEVIDCYDTISIQLDNINTENYILENDDIELISNNNHMFTFKIKNIYPLDKIIKVVPINDYKKVINESLILYNSEDSQDILSFETEYPQFLNPTSFNIHIKTGDLHLEKYDEFGNVVYDNIIFHIYDQNGNEIHNIDGSNFILRDGVINIKNILPVGKYYLIEQTPDQFIDKKEKIYFNIEKNKTTDLEIINYYKTFDFSFIKTDENSLYIDGVMFELYKIDDKGKQDLSFIQRGANVDLYNMLNLDDSNELVISERYSSFLNGHMFKSDKVGYFTYKVYKDNLVIDNGKIYIVDDKKLTKDKYNTIRVSLVDTLASNKINTFKNLDVRSKYILCEVEPKKGYDYLNNPCIYISYDDIDISKPLKIINIERLYNLKLLKTNDCKQILLDGATFTVSYYDSNGNLIESEYTTGETIKGGFIIKDIPYNSTVTIKEIKAPEGYIIDNDEFIIKPDLDYSEITFTNSRVNSAIIIPPYIPVKTCVE